MIAYLDASCLAGLILTDDVRDPLVHWIGRVCPTLTYSDLGWGEFVSAIGIRVRSGAIDADVGQELIGDAAAILRGWRKLDCVPEDLWTAAGYLADFSLKLRFPDAIHIAVARRAGGTFVTADTRQASAASAIGVTVFNPLQEPS